GAFYLGAQIELFEGDTSAALAAYNAGPGNGLRWSETAADDPDILLEIIDFSQTHAYVQLVLENYALYRYTYGQAEQPSLPLP
ncbi:MAG: transglycosylase SLT domain-containing protein, partial [Dehalococcoidia bacterium]